MGAAIEAIDDFTHRVASCAGVRSTARGHAQSSGQLEANHSTARE
ncbi:hypothetical protein NBRC3280_3397 [Acetobacter pasteurianus NBRC 3280]|uniref:Uncharacterized protein n=1 Tax=Acetobacter pasteurianus NBRC 3278 TaxID=1226660 RepID=A0A401X9D0_ACEPA|nr:hypothetical protein NBRC3277_3400 [Acetobacter pasteurianus NBRC 3277]GCD64426.1 hypothetical protein NBRC3278_3519 [Acetobacter pasteurianus NBRC 3278]GCD70762.1 hypothetical protein NBRC3280_3397 [Acetobacter pasteurianus NBRC 3280]